MFKPTDISKLLETQSRVVIRYAIVTGILNLVWEVLQLPLYSLWEDSDWARIAFAVVHCTAGDVLIALVSLLVAILVVGTHDWPWKRYWPTVVAAICTGLVYTVFSEWNNTVITRNWSYSVLMPQFGGIGLSPVAQWVIVPCATFWYLHNNLRRHWPRS